MDNSPKPNTKRQSEVDTDKLDAARSISERGARHFGGDPELARNFREWDQ